MPDTHEMTSIAADMPPAPALLQGPMPMAMAIWFDDKLFDRAKLIAKYMAGAQGVTPKHLVGKLEACFAVVTRSLGWRLDPFAVACSTYQTPGGNIGYEGKLCQAILDNSGKFDGAVRFEHYGDWSKVQGKFTMKESSKGGKYPSPAWNAADEVGIGVKVIGQVKGEADPRELRFDLVQAHPRNSTLWATDPKTQICYTAVRRFAFTCVPGIFMGTPFDHEEGGIEVYPGDNARSVNAAPEPRRADFKGRDAVDVEDRSQDDPAAPIYSVIMTDGAEREFVNSADAVDAALKEINANDIAGIAGFMESNTSLRETLVEQDGNPDAWAEIETQAKVRTELLKAPKERANPGFWAKEKLDLSPCRPKTDRPDWKWWTIVLDDAMREAQTREELQRLQIDNERNLQALKLADEEFFRLTMSKFAKAFERFPVEDRADG